MERTELVPTTGGELVTATDTNPAGVYLASLRPVGRYTMMRVLDRLAAPFGHTWRTMPWADLRFEHVAAIRSQLAERYAPATANTHLAAIRGVVTAAWRLGMMTAENRDRILDVKRVEGVTLPAGRAIGPGELAALMRSCTEDRTPAGARDAAILAVAYAGGLRRAELAGLRREDVVTEDGDTTRLVVRGKGNRERNVYIDNGASAALADYITIRGDDPGPLYYRGRQYSGQLLPGLGMTPQSIRNVVAKRARLAGIASASPHDLRRSFVGDLLDAGIDMGMVARMAGHANIQTTMRYDRRPEAGMRKAAKSLCVPYVRATR